MFNIRNSMKRRIGNRIATSQIRTLNKSVRVVLYNLPESGDSLDENLFAEMANVIVGGGVVHHRR
jgi:ribosomal protein S20